MKSKGILEYPSSLNLKNNSKQTTISDKWTDNNPFSCKHKQRTASRQTE